MNFSCNERPNGGRYRAGGGIGGKKPKLESGFRGRIPWGGAKAPDRPVHVMLGNFTERKTEEIKKNDRHGY